MVRGVCTDAKAYGGDGGADWNDVMPSTGVADMTLLSQVTNEQIKNNIGERFWGGVIYVSPRTLLPS